MFKENFRFVSKITLIHLLTYTACGITFSMILKYQASLEVTEGFRDMNHIMVRLSPIFQ
ncbi:MAG: hypothetical protein GX258_03295, partial [Clostridiales bacterium]|nr:hypothetical protein [Clostridiales bacterium]